jgi:biopolymer transport protein ExbD
MRFARTSQAETSPNIAPLLDVVLLLLIFFVVTTSFVEPQIALDLPSAETPARREATSLVVDIHASGALFVAGEPIELEALEARFRDAAARHEELEIRADRLASHGDVIAVLDRAQQTGLTRVGFATRATE